MATDSPSALPDDILESIANGNVKSITVLLRNLVYSNLISCVNILQENAVADQQAMNQLLAAVTGRIVNLLENPSPMEAMAGVKPDTGNDIADHLADIKGTIAAFSSPPPLPAVDDKFDSIEEQPAMLAYLALVTHTFNILLAQQKAVVSQQVIFQIELTAMGKCIQVLLAANGSEPQAIEQLAPRILEMFEQFHSKVEERLVASHNQMNDLMDKMRAHAKTDKPETA